VYVNLELVDKYCYVGNMLSVDGDADAARPEFELDGINSGSWYHCLDISLIMRGRLYSSCV